jgi:hypothetical protein
MRSIKNSRINKTRGFINCTILLFSQSENNKILESNKHKTLILLYLIGLLIILKLLKYYII